MPEGEHVWSRRNGWNSASSRVKGSKEVIKVDGRSSEILSFYPGIKLMIRVNNGGLNMPGNIDPSPFIDMDPIGSVPTVSFDLHAGTIPGGVPDEEPWVYKRADRPTYDEDDIWALPASEPPAIASSSNTSGVFCKDQILPLTFHVLNAQEHRSTVQTITVS